MANAIQRAGKMVHFGSWSLFFKTGDKNDKCDKCDNSDITGCEAIGNAGVEKYFWVGLGAIRLDFFIFAAVFADFGFTLVVLLILAQPGLQFMNPHIHQSGAIGLIRSD